MMGLEWVCPDCNHYKDTPNHEWGCATGRKEYGHEDEITMRELRAFNEWAIDYLGSLLPLRDAVLRRFYEDAFDEEWDEWH